MSTTSLSEARAHLSDHVRAVAHRRERVTITKRGRPVAVLVGSEDLDALLATIELLSDCHALASIAESAITSRHGFSYAEDDVWDGRSTYADEEVERRLVERLGREAYDAARAAIRSELLAHPDANVRERAKDYG